MRQSIQAPNRGSLQEAIQQSQPFRSRQQETYLSIVRTAVELSHSTERFLKKFGITQAQYNVLRILHGAGSNGLGRNEISQRMVAVTPDMTRLLDRLAIAGLVSRTRHQADKRHTLTTITDAGIDLLARVEQPLLQHHKMQLRGIPASGIDTLLASMSAIRSRLQTIHESK